LTIKYKIRLQKKLHILIPKICIWLQCIPTQLTGTKNKFVKNQVGIKDAELYADFKSFGKTRQNGCDKRVKQYSQLKANFPACSFKCV